ncbi:hypothetical protein OKW38_001891 [Paraburkholderia sp. MM5496-R1]|uniref:hypothetical protein n=1 Tax=Paraburkholderia sp. MM5496-R1 TaxID=2991065 RepID=UPI003D22DFF8
MLKRLVFFGFLALPGAFVVLTLVCMHPRYREKMAHLIGVPVLQACLAGRRGHADLIAINALRPGGFSL